VLPAVLAALVALALLSALALFDAVQEWRVAGLGDDRIIAQAALHEGLDALPQPTDLALLCVTPAVAPQARAGASTGGGSYHLAWSHVGGGLVRAVIEGRGRAGARARAIALLRPDSLDRSSGALQCPTATRLVPAGEGWLTAHPEG
jgi:hypothetical protein